MSRSEHLVDGPLILGRTEYTTDTMEDVDLADTACSALTGCESADREMHFHETLKLEPDPVNGVPVSLERLLANLIENAIVRLPAFWSVPFVGSFDSENAAFPLLELSSC